MRRARLFDPYLSSASLDALAMSHYLLGEYATARSIFRESLDRNNEAILARIFLISTLVRWGELDEAAWEVAELETMSPDFSMERWGKMQPFKDRSVMDALLADFSQVKLE